MEITDIKIHELKTEGNVKAMASFIFDRSFCVSGFRIIDSNKGLFLSMPSKKLDKPNKEGKLYIDTSYPLNAEFRKYMNDYAIAAYNRGVKPDFVTTAGLSEMANNRSEKYDDDSENLPF